MIVFSPLALYTTFIAWQQYNMIYMAFLNTGLLLLGFIYIVWRLFRAVVTASVDDKRAIANANNNYIYELLTTTLMFICFVIPIVPFHTTEISFKPICASKDTPVSKIGNSNTTYDDILSDIVLDKVKVPMAIYFIQKYTSAFTYALMATTGCQTNFNELKGEMISSYLPDSLKKELGEFKNQCYDNAKIKFHSEKPELSTYKEFLNQGGGEGDLNWMGSRILKKLYYPSIEAGQLVDGFDFAHYSSPSQREEYKKLGEALPKKQGYPKCSEWWDDRLLDEMEKAVNSYREGYGFNKHVISEQIDSLIKSNKIPGVANLTSKEIIAKTIINFRAKGMSNISTSNPYNLSGSDSGSFFSRGFLNAGNTARQFTSTPLKREALKQTLPIMQSSLYLFLVVMFIFFAVIGGYKPKIIISFSVLICFSILINYFWYLIGYVEKSLVGALDDGSLKSAIENAAITLYVLVAGILFGFAGLLGTEGGKAGGDSGSHAGNEASKGSDATGSLPGAKNVVK